MIIIRSNPTRAFDDLYQVKKLRNAAQIFPFIAGAGALPLSSVPSMTYTEPINLRWDNEHAPYTQDTKN